MSDLVHITTHEDDAVARLIGQYQGRPRFEAIVRAIVRQFQDIEDAAWDVFIQIALDAAVGNELDMIGDVVGQKRAGAADSPYRVYLAARIKTNRSDGKAFQLVAIAKLLLGSDNPIKYQEFYPSSIVMAADDVSVSALIVWRDFLHKAKGAAKSIHFGYSKQSPGNTIRFGSVYRGSTLSATQRPGSSHSTVYGGGKTSGIFG